MSTTPPNIPPPYDPKTQYRAFRQQQKSAWQAQRDAWKAQGHAWRASYTGPYVPRVPSIVGPVLLIAVGIVALLVATGHIDGGHLRVWYGNWWSLLLILAGLALLGEWFIDLRRPTPVRRSGSFVGIIVLLAFIGLVFSGWNRLGNLRPWQGEWGDHGDDFFNSFGLPEHDFDQPKQSQTIAANAVIDIQNPRGDINITAGDEAAIEVQAHEVAYASSDEDAKKIFDAEATHVTVSGSSVQIKSESNSNGRLNLTIVVPKTAKVSVNAGKGEVTAAGLTTGIIVTARGAVHLSEITGSVDAHFTKGKQDFSAHDIQGNVTVDGDLNDLTLSAIKGKVAQSGEILGDVHLEKIQGPVHLHTTVTDLELAELPGDLTLNSDDLRVNEAKGPVRVVTHSKDIDLSQISGDSTVEDRNGHIAVEPAGNYAVTAKNSKGDVEVTLPPSASASVDVATRNGDILSDFTMPSFGEGQTKAATFTIGSGKSKIVLKTDNGDIRIKKSGGASTEPPTPPTTPAAPAAAASPKAPKLKASKALPAQPVTQ